MWSSLARLAAGTSTPSRGKTIPEDPLKSFSRTWESLQAALSSEGRLPLGQSSIPRLLAQLLGLIASESSSASEPLGPCLEYLLKNNVLATLVKLVLGSNQPEWVRGEVIAWYGSAVVQLDENFLIHGAVSKPLVKLLRSCVTDEAGLSRSEEETVVDVMCTICERIKSYPELLVIFFRTKASPTRRNLATTGNDTSGFDDPPSDSEQARPSSPTPSTSASTTSYTTQSVTSSAPRKKSQHHFLLFEYLLRFVHREGKVGDFARVGLLFLVEVAIGSVEDTAAGTDDIDVARVIPTSLHPGARDAKLALAGYLLDSDFAEVLAAGLGALYGLLPNKLVVRSIDNSSSPGKATTWDDVTVDAGAGGMVLGGMGALGEDEDPDEAAGKREEEEMRLRSLGVGISGTDEFREGLDGWLKLVEFMQEVLRRSPAPLHAGLDDDDDSRLQRSTTSAVTSSILSSLRSLFLQNVLYPSILECSDGDGSAVAVLTYLDAMLGVVDEGTKLESAILGFLMGEEDLSHRTRDLEASPPLSVSTALKRKKSSALVLLESGTPRAQPNPSSSYFTSLGRFSLKDLILSNVHSTSQPTSTAALRLLQTLLTRHDRWSMGLLDVVLDDGATSFPTAWREIGLAVEEDEEGEVSEDDSDVFIYPANEDDSTQLSNTTPTSKRTLDATASATPSRLLLGRPLPSTPTVKAHFNSLDTLLSLISSIDPTYRKARAMGGESEILSTGFANYLKDAEAAMSSDLGFKRGLSASHLAPSHPISQRRRSSSGGRVPTSDLVDTATMYKHNLVTTSRLLSLILDSFAHFFSHSPDHNLALTAVLASLALCPYRSLEGWMLPGTPGGGETTMGTRISKGSKELESEESDDGEDRSVDGDIDELSRHDALLSSSPPPYDLPEMDDASCLLSILSALSNSVSHYRHSIANFDVYLSERRQGLMFVENLADALDLNDGDGNAFGDAVKALSVSPPSPSTPSTPRASTFGAFLSPRPPSQSIPDPYATPPRARSTSSTSQTPTIGTGIGSASPFAVHYRETGSISVHPVIVASPAHHRLSPLDAVGGPPDSPTKRLSSLPPPSSNVSVSESEGGMEEREVKEVTLSTILDNTIVLEEFVKELASILHVRTSLGIDVRRFF